MARTDHRVEPIMGDCGGRYGSDQPGDLKKPGEINHQELGIVWSSKASGISGGFRE